MSSLRARCPSATIRRRRRCSARGSSCQVSLAIASATSTDAAAPASIRVASSTSSWELRSGTLPISLRYMRTGSDEPLARAMATAATRAGSSRSRVRRWPLESTGASSISTGSSSKGMSLASNQFLTASRTAGVSSTRFITSMTSSGLSDRPPRARSTRRSRCSSVNSLGSSATGRSVKRPPRGAGPTKLASRRPPPPAARDP